MKAMLKVGGVLAALVLLAAPVQADFLRTAIPIWSGAAGDTTAVGMADSSTVLDSHGAQRMVLFLKPNKACRVAIRLIACGDSTTFSGAVALTDSTKSSVWPFNCAAVTTAGDSVVYHRGTLPTSVQNASFELVHEFQQYGVAKWGAPLGDYIDLRRICDGTWFTADRFYVMVRVLGGAPGVITWIGSVKCYTWQ